MIIIIIIITTTTIIIVIILYGGRKRALNLCSIIIKLNRNVIDTRIGECNEKTENNIMRKKRSKKRGERKQQENQIKKELKWNKK